jgi:uncharacterized membrane protein
MSRIAGIAGKAILVIGLLGYQLLVHLGVTASALDPARAALLAAPMVAVGAWILVRSPHRLMWILVLAAAVAMTWFVGHASVALYGVPHAAAYLFLLWLFGRTLREGREPLITRLARLGRGDLPPAMEAYTRKLTLAWCVFFAAQLAVSALLLHLGWLESWSLFINVLNLPLCALMFVGDYLYRVARYRDWPQSSIAKVIRAYARDRASTQLPH